MSGVQHVTVRADEAEQRLDRWFRRHFPAVKQGRLERMCRRGEVRVDGARAKTATRVAPGQVIRVPPLPEEGEAASLPAAPARPHVDDRVLAEIRDAVLWMDDHVIALSKPPGLAVQGGTGQKRHLDMLLPALRFGRQEDPRLVHRLDKETSGVLVLARTGAVATALTRAFRTRDVDKTYLAVVAGRPRPAEGVIRLGLLREADRPAGGRMRVLPPDEVAATEGAVGACTEYRVLSQLGNRSAWVALRPVTGRTHQLRAHMAALGCPIVGDGRYGGRSQQNLGDGWGAGLGGEVSRMLHLHAFALAFPHPVSGERVELTAPLPAHMTKTADLMGWDAKTLALPLFD